MLTQIRESDDVEDEQTRTDFPCTELFLSEKGNLAIFPRRLSSDDMRNISGPSWYLQSLIRDVCEHNEALNDDECATKDVP
jgi:hypothetical protein